MLSHSKSRAAVVALLIAIAPIAAPRAEAASALRAVGRRITVVDDHHTRVTLAAVPRRIVALAPNVVEILYAVGAGNRVIGVSQDSTYPAAAARKPVVVTYTSINVEKIVALHPDLIVGAGIDAAYLPKLRALRLPTIILDPSSIAGILHDIGLVGTATGSASSANALMSRLAARVAHVRDLLRRVPGKPRVYYEYDYEKAGGFTYGPGSFGDNLITLAGGTNIGRIGKLPYPQLTTEQIIGERPQVIILGDARYGVSVAAVRRRPGFTLIPAVQTRHVYPFDDDLVSRPGPRSVDGLEAMARLLHPEAFRS